jgi:hypothetical protein
MRKVLITVAVAAMALGGANAAIADPGNGNGAPFGPGSINPDHPAWYGLCTAYYNNSDQGKQNGAPFQALEDHDWDNSDYDGIDDFCSSMRPGNRGDDDKSSAPTPGPRGDRG